MSRTFRDRAERERDYANRMLSEAHEQKRRQHEEISEAQRKRREVRRRLEGKLG